MPNGKLGATLDMNDVVGIAQFQTTGSSNYYTLNAMPPVVSMDTVAKAAGDTIGFQMFWSDPAQTPTTAHYGVSSYDPTTNAWQTLAAFPTASQSSVPATEPPELIAKSVPAAFHRRSRASADASAGTTMPHFCSARRW